MDPDFVMSRSDMARRLLFAFSEYEVEEEEKNKEEAKKEKSRRRSKRGGR